MHACMGWNKAWEGGLYQFSHGLPYSGYHPAAPCLSSGGMYTLGSTFASGAVCAVSSGLQALSRPESHLQALHAHIDCHGLPRTTHEDITVAHGDVAGV